MDISAWNTKSDLLGDLEMVLGETNVEDTFILSGYGPPPALQTQEGEDELMLQFGVTSSGKNVTYGQPDLEGIQAMIKMADNYENTVGEAGCSVCPEDSEIIISKLNPNIPEFIPKTQGKENHKNNNNVVEDNNFDKQLLDLRHKIRNASISKNKIEKNAAVISLLKLQAKQSSQGNTSPVLLTPDYFKKPLITEGNVSPSSEEHTSPIAEITPSPSNIDPNKIDLNSSDVSVDGEIEKSVEKVNNWLNPQQPIVKKTAKLHLGPITFQKKSESGNSLPSSRGSQIEVARYEYVPSQRARELTDMYTKRVEKMKNAAQQKSQIVTFDNLAQKLSERDQIIKAKLRNQ